MYFHFSWDRRHVVYRASSRDPLLQLEPRLRRGRQIKCVLSYGRGFVLRADVLFNVSLNIPFL